MIQAGKYLARAVSGKIGESKEKKTPAISVVFEFEYEGKPTHLTWTGWITTSTLERTCQSLAYAGYNEEKATNAKDGVLTKDHFEDVEVEIVVENETYAAADGSQKVASKIKWVNKPGGSSFGLADVTNVSAVSDTIRREMIVAREKLGLNKKIGKPVVKNYAEDVGKEELPF